MWSTTWKHVLTLCTRGKPRESVKLKSDEVRWSRKARSALTLRSLSLWHLKRVKDYSLTHLNEPLFLISDKLRLSNYHYKPLLNSLKYVMIHGIWSMIIKASLSKGVKYAFVSIQINNGFYYIFETRMQKSYILEVSKSRGTSHIFQLHSSDVGIMHDVGTQRIM